MVIDLNKECLSKDTRNSIFKPTLYFPFGNTEQINTKRDKCKIKSTIPNETRLGEKYIERFWKYRKKKNTLYEQQMSTLLVKFTETPHYEV